MHKCTKCGKQSEDVIPCILEGQIEEYLCIDCIEDSGYCMGCGQFWAGVSSFDFSPIAGYCEHCVDEIKTNHGEYDLDMDDYNDFIHYDDSEESEYGPPPAGDEPYSNIEDFPF